MLATTVAITIALTALIPGAAAQYKIDTRDDVLKTSTTLARHLVTLYQGNKAEGDPGLIDALDPLAIGGGYNVGHAASVADTLIGYWHATGDDSHNDLVFEGASFFAGDSHDFLPSDYSATMANSDRGYWAMAAMSAVENGFPTLPNGHPSWLALAQNAFEGMSRSIEEANGRGACEGGLPFWAVMDSDGEQKSYLNSEAIGTFFNLAARLARYTGNETYAERANDAWDWVLDVLVDQETWAVYDGTHGHTNCTVINRVHFSAGAGLLTHGAAFMYNHTDGSRIWRERAENLTGALIRNFFPEDVAFEPACEALHICPPDALAMKGQVHRWLSVTTQIAPSVAETVLPVLRKSAQAAVDQCTGGKHRRQCGFYWSEGVFRDPLIDKTSGMLEQLNVLAAVQSILVPESLAPRTKNSSQDTQDDQDGQNSDDVVSQTATGSAGPLSPSSAATPESRAAWGKKYDPLTAWLLVAGLGWMLTF